MNREKLQQEYISIKTKLREIERNIRATKRELVPLTTGLVMSIKKDRCHRLRAYVRQRDTSCIKIQALWRRAIVRTYYMDPYRDYWIECFDEEQGPDIYYYNTWSQITTW